MAARYVKVVEAAEICRAHPLTVRRWIAEGKLRAIKPRHAFLIDEKDLEAFLASGRGTQSDREECLGGAVDDLVQAIVDAAPELTQFQVARLRQILGR